MNRNETLQITTPTDREVVMTRVFDASQALVFEASTRPEVLKRWLIAPGRSMEICEIDLRPGGAYRFVWRGPNKKDVGMHGIYREVSPPERFVRTEAWEDWDAGETLVTTTFESQGSNTRLTTTVLFPSREIRDEVLRAGLQHGANESFDKLAECLAGAAAAG